MGRCQSLRTGIGSGNAEVGIRKWEVGSGKWECGSGNSEVGSGNAEVGIRNAEVGRFRLRLAELQSIEQGIDESGPAVVR